MATKREQQFASAQTRVIRVTTHTLKFFRHNMTCFLVCRKNPPKQNKTFATECFDTTRCPCFMHLSEVARSKPSSQVFKCIYKHYQRTILPVDAKCLIWTTFAGTRASTYGNTFVKTQYSIDIHHRHINPD